MRLTKIKLAGFKSFVDPTTVEFKTNMMAIVGPNGCGKSNVIDAVRWVMGESSAKYLRGENSTDVIFNGSTARKPVGQASIELIFDNSDGRLEGQFANYNEVSVKRLVTRDGQSTYFLNSGKCRKRDVTDLFLGTGLGPRSYAIIQQGTISRLIEAKPEELRVYIEEAAGISKYKERRKETETRIRHTRENLERLADLREEVDKQLDKLKRQASAAEKYKELKNLERNAQSLLLAVRLRDISDSESGQQQNISALSTEFEQHMALQREAERKLEEARQTLAEANEFLNQSQANFYQAGSDVARLEQTIQHRESEKQQLGSDLQRLELQIENATQELANDKELAASISAQIDSLIPELEIAQEQDLESEALLEELEERHQLFEEQWDQATSGAAEPLQKAQADRAKITELEKQLTRLSGQMEKLREEKEQLSSASLTEEREDIAEALMVLEEQLDEFSASISDSKDKTSDAKRTQSEVQQLIHEKQSLVSQLKGKLSSLTALQDAAMADTDESFSAWCQQAGLNSDSKFIDQLTVESGYELAVEAALGGFMSAVITNSMPEQIFSSDIPTGIGDVNIVVGNASNHDTSIDLPAIADFINFKDKLLSGFFAGIYYAATPASAMLYVAKLGAQEKIVTANGMVLTAASVHISDADALESGVIARKQEISRLARSIESESDALAAFESQLLSANETISVHEYALQEAQTKHAEIVKEQSSYNARKSALDAQISHVEKRATDIEFELTSLQTAFNQDNEAIELTKESLSESLALAERLAEQKQQLSNQREELRQSLQAARASRTNTRESWHQLKTKHEGLLREQSNLASTQLRMEEIAQQLAVQKRELLARLERDDDPVENLQMSLDEKLEARLLAEESLATARDKVQNLEQEIRTLDEQRLSAEKKAYEVRTKLEQLRISAQDAQTRINAISEQFSNAGIDQQELMAELPAELNEAQLLNEIEQLDGKISRLGAINLAAIEEYDEQSKRSEYLTSQDADLNSALETLESAIRKIDRETRARFKDTYDKINAGIQRIFPKAFGGGEAYLELTGDDLLDTGVSVMARPPGKKNSTIHLLSGGEKALTALSLVFAIFELNPAPFCLLDEVDAPLDEANVGRFCQMVKEMSKTVQFMYITHNKQAMEMGAHLVGVTMHEPGASRIVSVDLDEAEQLAAM